MEIYPDFRDLLALFNAHEVAYLVVGGYALAHHGVPRYTGDMDLYVEPSHANAERIMAALEEFGFGDVGLAPEDFRLPRKVIQLGVSPVRVDIVTSIDGVDWPTAWAHREEAVYGNVRVPVIGRPQLVANKRAAGRGQDLADLEALGDS
ncbi:MAG: hypothetical protein ACOC8F_06140 [Planctomycetota bacterium]